MAQGLINMVEKEGLTMEKAVRVLKEREEIKKDEISFQNAKRTYFLE